LGNIDYDILEVLNFQLVKHAYLAYGDRAALALDKFRTEDIAVLRKHYLYAVLNPLYDYSKEALGQRNELFAV
jgi:hypothetical protein